MEEGLEKIVVPLLKWYKKNARVLPWRENKTPYTIWLSEIMLQQTRIEAVKRYYVRFLEELPTIFDLAEVEEQKLLKLWEGLGYYNRARNLQKAARLIVSDYEGKMPLTYEELVKLPGIGEYTAGAIASIAYDERVPAVDGNVLRVISRVLGNRKDILLLDTKKEITKQIEKVIPKEAGDFNQALMELGELVCVPNGEPLCEKCPWRDFCVAYKEDLTDQIPVRKNKVKRRKEEVTVFLMVCEDRVAIRKRENKGLLASMYEFPNIQRKIEEEKLTEVLQKWNLKQKKVEKVGKHHHIFSHIEWDMEGYQIEVEKENGSFIWVEEEKLKKEYPLPSAFIPFQKKLKIKNKEESRCQF